MRGRFRRTIRATTGKHFWLRYFLLASWRLAYSAVSQFTRKVSTGECEQPGHAETIFNNYKRYAGITTFRGRVAEVGPGNVSGVALRLIGEGCSLVDQLDPFKYDYQAHPQIRRFQVAAEQFFQSNRGYDYILSTSVMEHLYDPLTAIRAMAAALNPGGVMVHSIDCEDHGQFSDQLHKLSFLRLPAGLYKPLTFSSGLNRVRPSAYESLCQELGLDTTVLYTGLTGINGAIEPQRFDQITPSLVQQSHRYIDLMRGKLAQPFREMSDPDLMATVFVLVARR